MSTGLCLDDSQSGTENGNTVDQRGCNNSVAQYWSYDYDTGALVLSGHPSMCLDDYGFNGSQGALIDLWQCNGTEVQQWSYVNGQLINAVGYMSLDEAKGNRGTQADLYSCTGSTNVLWYNPASN